MESYGFTLELSRDIIDSEAETIKSSCSDATVKYIPTGIDTGYTGTLVEFAREAESLEKAIESAMHDIEAVPDLHATGITIPAPERDESGAVAESAGTESSADVEPGTKTEAKPGAKKAIARKSSTRKSSGTRKSAAGKGNANGQENGTDGERDGADTAAAK